MTITKDTKMSLGLIGTIILTGVASTWTIASRLSAMDARLRSVEDAQWTLTQESEHALRLAIENPGMRVPDPRWPGKVILVRGSQVDEGGG